jgi:glycosyltransferase involved in cell wall biosynthesis
MRILRVIRSTDLESGGPIESLIRSSNILHREGHQIEVVSLDPIERAGTWSLPYPLHPLGIGSGKYGFNAELTPWIRRNANRFDLAILHGVWNYSSFGAWRALHKMQTPYVIFTHGMLDPWFRKKYPLKHAFKQIYWLLAEGRVLRDARHVLFTSEEERYRARGAFRGYGYRERVVSYGTADPVGDPQIEEVAFQAQLPDLAGNRFLLFIGRIHPKKGCDLLIEAFASCLKSIPADVDLVMAGPDQVGWADELKSMAARCGVADRIHWPGMLRGDEKWGAIRRADALILPSHQENFGVVVAEAMACSIPVLISDKVNIWREVEASEAGFVENDDLEGTQNLIRRFYGLSKTEVSRIRSSARRGFEKHFNIVRSANDLLSVLDPLANKERSGSGHGWKILHVIRSTEAATGGPIEWLYRLSQSLAAQGHFIEVVSLEDSVDCANRSLPFPVMRMGKGFGKYGFNTKLARWMEKHAPDYDIVILHGLWNYSSFGSWRGLHKTSTPYLVFPHGMMDPWFREHYPFKHIKKRLYWFLAEGKVLRDASRAVFTCEEERERARGVFGNLHYTEHVVRLGTMDPKGDLEQQRACFHRAFPKLIGRRYLLFLSRIHPKKGCDMLLEAYARSIDQLPPDVDLVIAGPDKHNLVPGLQDLARRRGIASRVHWSGMIDGDLKWGAFRCAEALLFPSHQENFGIVVAESMACSTPVLISDKVNIWREIETAGAGLVSSDDLEGTRKLIRQFFGMTEQKRLEMREAARAGYLKYFKIERAATELTATIDQILEESGHAEGRAKPESISA